jgi:tetratricopeptide (TPR) repeat protein
VTSVFRKFFENKKIKVLKLQVESMPNDPTARFNLGVAYVKCGRYEDAIREFEETLKSNPKSAEANYNLGILYGKIDEGKKAIMHILEAGNLFSNKNDEVNKMEARGLLRQYYRKFNTQAEDVSRTESEI